MATATKTEKPKPYTPPACTADPIREREIADTLGLVPGAIKVESTGFEVQVTLSPAQFDQVIDALRYRETRW